MSAVKNHIALYNDLSIFYTSGLSKKLHSNHAVKVIVAEEPIIVSHNRKRTAAKGFIIQSDTLHKVIANNSLVVSLYIDPETEIGHAINKLVKRHRLLKLENASAERICDFFTESFENHITELEAIKQLTKILISNQLLDAEPTIDNRIQVVVDAIKTAPNFNIKFNALLNLCSLSESRLIHLFKQETGINIRKYVLWCRLQIAVKSLAGGSSITQAAKLAGFTDAAHLSRTFVSMFGIAPSLMLK